MTTMTHDIAGSEYAPDTLEEEAPTPTVCPNTLQRFAGRYSTDALAVMRRVSPHASLSSFEAVRTPNTRRL